MTGADIHRRVRQIIGDEAERAAAPNRRRSKAEWRMVASPTDPRHTLLPARVIARGEGFVMVRRPRAIPFVIDEQTWADAPLQGSL